MYMAKRITEEESHIIKYLKAVFIIMVLFLHSYQEKINLGSGTLDFASSHWLMTLKWGVSFGISDVAVPGFFILSAYLLYKKDYDYGKNLKKKCKSILIPYILMNTIWIFFFACVQQIPALGVFFTNESFFVTNWSIMDWLNAYIGLQTGSPILYPLWFLLNLMVLNLAAPIFQIFVDRFPRASLIVFLLMWVFIGTIPIFCLRITSICAWGIGCILANNREDISEKNINKYSVWIKKRLTPKYLLILYIPILIVDIALHEWAYYMPIHRVSILLGLLFWYSIAVWQTKLKVSMFIDVISSYSFGIYIFHEMNMSIFQKICGKFLPATIGWQILQYLFIPVIILICCLILCFLLKNFLPQIYKVLTGAR